ncbi:MAG: hypothetical protein XD98_0383 [Microgenomates bacterium 39_6]|nr:MAG: hypothetical protein XD98_0383 [Microgenomates bacterium 39_6]
MNKNFKLKSYLDTNALINLWTNFVKINNEIDSNININKTVFKECCTSIYAIDEMLISKTKDLNNLLNNISFLLIFQNIPIIKPFPNIVKTLKPNKNLTIDHFENKDAIANILFRCATQFFLPESQKWLKYHIQKKEEFAEASSWFIKPYGSNKANYSKKKISLENKIDKLIRNHDINEPESFLHFCMELFVALRNRELKKPANISREKIRKPPEKSLNQQYDFYHLCYSKYFNEFVTDDIVLSWILETLNKKNITSVKIYNSKSFFDKQSRELALRK